MPTSKGAIKHTVFVIEVEGAAQQAAPAREEAAEQAAPAWGRGRPKGCKLTGRIRTVKFKVVIGVEAMTDLASNTHHPWWTWDGKSYPQMEKVPRPQY